MSFHRIWIVCLTMILQMFGGASTSNEINISKQVIKAISPNIQNKNIYLHCEHPVNYTNMTWMKDGKILPSIKESLTKLSITLTASLSIKGIYSCEGYNKDRKLVRETTNVDVYGELYFLEAPQLQNFTKNTTATIKCILDGDPPADSIKWMKDGKEIVPSNANDRIYVDNTVLTTLVVKNIQVSDEGNYTCIAIEEQYNQRLDRDIRVDVQYQPENVTIASSGPGKQGKNLTLNCSADANPAPAFRWYRGISVNEDSLITDSLNEDGSKLTLVNANSSDAGEYTCFVENERGNETKTTSVTIYYAPRVQFLPKGPVKENSSITIQCIADGVPKMTIGIFKNDVKIDALEAADARGRRLEENDTAVSVIFDSVSYSDAGMYQCRAKNIVGSGSDIMKLDVLYKPKWGSLPTKVLGCESEVATLRCHFLGNPTPTMKWFEEKTSLKNITNANDTEVLTPVTSTTAILTPIVAKNVTTFYQESRNSFGSKLEKMEISSSNEMYDLKQTDGFLDLRIKQVTSESFKKYYCQAINRFGQSTQIIELNQATVPNPPNNITVFNITTSRAVVKFSTFQKGVPTAIKNYTVTINNTMTGITASKTVHHSERKKTKKTTLRKLNHNTIYSVQVVAINCKGESMPSEKQFFTTGAITKPEKVKITSSPTSRFPNNYTVTWEMKGNGGGNITKIKIVFQQIANKNGSQPPEPKKIIIYDTEENFRRRRVVLSGLEASTNYVLNVTIFNVADHAVTSYSFVTAEKNTATFTNESTSLAGGISLTVIIVIVAVAVVLLILLDVALCANKNCGLTHCVYSSVCKSSYSSQEIEDVEEGSARYRKETESQLQKKKESWNGGEHETQPLAENASPMANGTEPEPEILAEDTPLKAGQSNLKPDGNEDQQLKIESTNEKTSSEDPAKNTNEEQLHATSE